MTDADHPDGQRPERDSVTPALEEEPTPDEPNAPERFEMGGDDDLRAGQYGPDPTPGEA